MTFEQKDVLNERITAAIESIDADYAKAQNAASAARELYCQMREQAKFLHNQRMILLQAQGQLWNDKEEFL